MTIKDFLASLRTETACEYRTTLRYLELWQIEKETYPTFREFFRDWEISEHTIAKHLRQAKHIAKKCSLDYDIGNAGCKPILQSPPTFKDNDFQSLVSAFADCEYPKYIIGGERRRFWETLIHFVAVTALRRQAVLGLQVSDIHFDELYVEVPSNIDKKDKTRFKPITAELAADIAELRRFYDTSLIRPELHNRLFPWCHGDKQWYKCWNAAEEKVGKGCVQSFVDFLVEWRNFFIPLHAFTWRYS